MGVRYNQVTAKFATIPATVATPTVPSVPAVVYGDTKNDRIEVGAGWFLTKNIMLKGEYVKQNYKDYPTADYRNGGEFKGYVIQAVVGF